MSDDQLNPQSGRGRSRGRARARTVQELQFEHQKSQQSGRYSPSDTLRSLRVHGDGDSPPSDEERRRYSDDKSEEDDGNGNDENEKRNRRPTQLGSRSGLSKPPSDDQVKTREEGKPKQGIFGTPIPLIANYFDVKRVDSWTLLQYRADYEPEIDNTRFRKYLFRQNTNMPPYVFDGTMLFVIVKLGEDLLHFTSRHPVDESPIIIKLKIVGKMDRHDETYIQFYNLMSRKCLQMFGLTPVGRNFFNPDMKIEILQHGLQIWPGFLTTMRHYDRGLLYSVQALHKVLSTDTVLTLLNKRRDEILGRGGNMDKVKEALRCELIGVTVLTQYNNKIYRVDDIAWSENPSNSFEMKGELVTFVEYYRNRYNCQIITKQPLLVSNPKKVDVHRGHTAPFKLIPELCIMTGLTDAMRQNFGLMKDMGQYLFQPPQKKVDTISHFMDRMRQTEQIQLELRNWGLDIGSKMIEVPGRQLPQESVLFNDRSGQQVKEMVNEHGDFTSAFRNYRMISCVPLRTWVVIVPARDLQNVDNLIKTMQQVARPMGFNIDNPADVLTLQLTGVQDYLRILKRIIEMYQSNLQMIMTILPNNRLELYAAIKKCCYVEYGVSSQCFLVRNLTARGLMSIATKVTVQMNCKLGGQPWLGNIPLKTTMIVGFDVHHSAPGSNTPSVGAMVSTMNETFGQCYSTVTLNQSRQEITTNMAVEFMKCLTRFEAINRTVPERIIFYRDGVGEGQLHSVYTVELESIKQLTSTYYGERGIPLPKFTFIVVSKRINTRIFTNKQQNPMPGTIVDDVITLLDRYDFYLIAHSVRQGTVSPTSYNIIFDKSGLDPDKIQRLTNKLCYMYYNYSGSVAVPSPCQYAHKLAYLTGFATKSECKSVLSDKLYFL